MSSASQNPDQETELSAFREVQKHRDVCGNCFQRTHHTYERNYAVDTVLVEPFKPAKLWARKVDLPPRSYPVRKNRVPLPQDLAAQGVVNICSCGQPPGEQLRPLPKKLFFEYAENLYERYTEFGIQVHEDRFFEVLSELKTDPERQFADDRLFEKATKQAIKQ